MKESFRAVGTREAKAEKKVWCEFRNPDSHKELKHGPRLGAKGRAGPEWLRKHCKESRVPSSTYLSY